MALLDRVPGVKKFKEAKGSAEALVFSTGNSVIKRMYKSARSNFSVVAIGIDSGVVVPAIVRKCERFYFDNRKEANWSDEAMERMDKVFSNVNAEKYLKEDSDWVKGFLLSYLKDRERIVSLKLLKLVKGRKSMFSS